MNEFKGTKGKWHQKHGDVYSDIQDGDDAICDVYNWSDEEGKANALLISKAPEMLEVLIKTKERLSILIAHPKWVLGEFGSVWEEYSTISTIIKEATELK